MKDNLDKAIRNLTIVVVLMSISVVALAIVVVHRFVTGG